MDIEQESIIALTSFKNTLKDKREYGNDGYQFDGFITYRVKDKTLTELLKSL